MRPARPALSLLAVLASILSACSGASTSSEGSPPTFAARQATHAPGQAIVLDQTDAGPRVAPEDCAATFAGEPVTLASVDGGALALLAPDVDPGMHVVRVSTPRGDAEVSIEIGAATAIADPASAVAGALAEVRETLDALAVRAAEADAPPSLAEDLETLETWYAEASAAADAAGDAELAAAARILAANGFGASGSAAAKPTGATASRTALWRYAETCIALHGRDDAADCLSDRVMERLVPLVASAAVLVVDPEPLTKVVALVATAAQLLWLNDWLLEEVGAGIVQVGELAFAGGASSEKLRARAALATAAPGTLVVESGVSATVSFSSAYRAPAASDAEGSGLLGTIAGQVARFGAIWRTITSVLPAELRGAPFALPATPAGDRAVVDGDHVTVSISAPTGVTVAMTRAGDLFTFEAESTVGTEQTVRLEVQYASAVAQSSTVLLLVVRQPTCTLPEGATGTQIFGPSAFEPFLGDPPTGTGSYATAWQSTAGSTYYASRDVVVRLFADVSASRYLSIQATWLTTSASDSWPGLRTHGVPSYPIGDLSIADYVAVKYYDGATGRTWSATAAVTFEIVSLPPSRMGEWGIVSGRFETLPGSGAGCAAGVFEVPIEFVNYL